MKNINVCKKYGSKLFLASGLSMLSFGAFAALPAAVGTAITGLQTDGEALFALIWPVLIALTATVILMKLFKRGASKI